MMSQARMVSVKMAPSDALVFLKVAHRLHGEQHGDAGATYGEFFRTITRIVQTPDEPRGLLLSILCALASDDEWPVFLRVMRAFAEPIGTLSALLEQLTAIDAAREPAMIEAMRARHASILALTAAEERLAKGGLLS